MCMFVYTCLISSGLRDLPCKHTFLLNASSIKFKGYLLPKCFTLSKSCHYESYIPNTRANQKSPESPSLLISKFNAPQSCFLQHSYQQQSFRTQNSYEINTQPQNMPWPPPLSTPPPFPPAGLYFQTRIFVLTDFCLLNSLAKDCLLRPQPVMNILPEICNVSHNKKRELKQNKTKQNKNCRQRLPELKIKAGTLDEQNPFP